MVLNSRVIPCLLLQGAGLVKTRKFSQPTYVGDPLNAIRIFNEKDVDELIVLDILATEERRDPRYSLLEDIASECFMPLCVGGGIRRLDQMERLFQLGVEKVSLNSILHENLGLLRQAAEVFGSQSLVASFDVRRSMWGKYRVYAQRGSRATAHDPVDWARRLEDGGAGELLVTAVDREGTMSGYDCDLIGRVTQAVTIPVIANGGAGAIGDFHQAVQQGASAAAAGSLFVFHGKHRAVLISYPSEELRRGPAKAA